MKANGTPSAMRLLRLRDVRSWIAASIERPLEEGELSSLARLNEQDLHLLAAAVDRAGSNR
jgi:hypothetical protein